MGTTRDARIEADAAMVAHIEEVVAENSVCPEVLEAERYPDAATLEAERMTGHPRRGRF